MNPVVGDQLWAHHPVFFAIPALVPAVVVVAVVLHIARQGRREEREERELIDRAFEDENNPEKDR